MKVIVNNGTQSSFYLDDIRKISFMSGNMTVTQSNGVSDNFELKNIQNLSFFGLGTFTEEVKESATISIFVYPNPVIDFLNLNFTNEIGQAFQLEIISLDGKIYYSKYLTIEKEISLDVSYLPRGIYLCSIINKKLVKTIKFIKN